MSVAKRRETIILLNGQGQYNVTRHFITDLAEAFAAIGYEAAGIDLTENAWVRELERQINEKNVFAFVSVNAIGIDLKVGNNALFDQLKIPLCAFLVDHPMYHIPRLTTGVNNLIVSCIDNSHLEFLRAFMKGQYTKVFIPHGAPMFDQTKNAPPFRERDIDLLFLGTYSDPERLRQNWLSLPPAVSRIYDEIMENALEPSGRTIVEIAQSVLMERGVDPEYMQHLKFWTFLEQVDRYVRALRRNRFVGWLAKLGVRAELYGNGWEKLRLPGSQLKINSPVDFMTARQLMRRSKMVATVLPNFTEGGHERIFTSMAEGAVCLTDGNRYLERQFKDREDILFYAFNEDSVAKALTLLEDTDLLQRIADNGRGKTARSHTWLNRAQAIADTVVRHRFFLA